ncbi:MAG: hypothetical protein GX963_06955 [Bacteroidales bacterium]|nr:hypothetical protein [Bacteroidales bacterium]
MVKDFWNKRYSKNEYVYGEQPNLFFKEIIDTLPIGRILLPADGEGRNGVYAASKGWNVDSFDISHEAKMKALNLSKSKGVDLSYKVMGMDEVKDCMSSN